MGASLMLRTVSIMDLVTLPPGPHPPAPGHRQMPVNRAQVARTRPRRDSLCSSSGDFCNEVITIQAAGHPTGILLKAQGDITREAPSS